MLYEVITSDDGIIATSTGTEIIFGTVFSEGGTITNQMGCTAMGGTTGNDVLAAPDTNYNVLFGYDGDDTLTGGTGMDMLIGGSGTDSIDGGDGGDTVSFCYDSAGVTVDLYGLGGFGALQSGQNAIDGEGNAEVITNVENVFGSAYNDCLGGNNASNYISGLAGDDFIYGGQDGANILSGGTGSDTFAIRNNFV